MNREAAALGVPVYSIFRGTIGAVDQYLARAGRLILLDSEESVWKKIKLVRREKTTSSKQANGLALQSIVEQVFTLDRELRSGGVSSKNSTKIHS
jgi:predicted glycosyltransferase